MTRGDSDEVRAPFGLAADHASRSASSPSAPHAAPTGLERHGESAARIVAQAILSGADRNRVEVRLDPPELGRVSIDLRMDDGAVAASVSADRPETLDLLRRHADTLQRELAAAGFERATLSFGERGEGGDRRAVLQGRDGAAGFESAKAEIVATRPGAARSPSDRLDIRL